MRIPQVAIDEGRVLGALVRGTLTPRNLRGWRPAPGEGLVGEAFGRLHADIFFALLGSLEAWGRVDLRRVVTHLGPAAGVTHDGKLLGYLPDLARRAPGRGEARWALAMLEEDALERRRARIRAEAPRRAAEQAVRILAGELAAMTPERRVVAAAGMAAALGSLPR